MRWALRALWCQAWLCIFAGEAVIATQRGELGILLLTLYGGLICVVLSAVCWAAYGDDIASRGR